MPLLVESAGSSWSSALDHCLSYWFHSTASASWLNQVLPFWPKIFLSITPLPDICASSLIKAKQLSVCRSSHGGSSPCPRSSVNIQAQGFLKEVQQCREILNWAMPRTKIQVKTLLTSGKKGEKEQSWDRKQQGERGWLLLPTWKLVTAPERVHFSPLWCLTGHTDFDKLPALIPKLFLCWNRHLPHHQAEFICNIK